MNEVGQPTASNADNDNVLDDLMQNNVQFDEDEKFKEEKIEDQSDISEEGEADDASSSESEVNFLLVLSQIILLCESWFISG